MNLDAIQPTYGPLTSLVSDLDTAPTMRAVPIMRCQYLVQWGGFGASHLR